MTHIQVMNFFSRKCFSLEDVLREREFNRVLLRISKIEILLTLLGVLLKSKQSTEKGRRVGWLPL